MYLARDEKKIAVQLRHLQFLPVNQSWGKRSASQFQNKLILQHPCKYLSKNPRFYTETTLHFKPGFGVLGRCVKVSTK